jgi:hypothetical protein
VARGLVEELLLVGGELELDDLLDAAGAEQGGDAHEEAGLAELAVEVGGAGMMRFLSLTIASTIWMVPEAGA